MLSMPTIVCVCVVFIFHVSVAWILRPHAGRSMQVTSLRRTGLYSPRRCLAPFYCAVKEDFNKYTYLESGVEYDVPFIKDPMWYRLLVRKNSEGTVFEALTTHLRTVDNGKLIGKVADAFYPRKMLLKFKGKKQTGDGLAAVPKAMIPGLVFVHTMMNADIADTIEGIDGVRGFLKGRNSRVAPLSDSEVAELDVLRSQQIPELSAEAKRLRIGDYVSVVGGRLMGRYGIIEGASDGRIQVCLRSEYRDSHDVIDVQDLRYLAAPPEIHHLNMTAKEAVEALLIKEPNGETLRFLRKEGLLNQILHPERSNHQHSRSRGGYRYGSEEQRQGREGGRSQRSIAVEDQLEPSAAAPSVLNSASNEDSYLTTAQRQAEDEVWGFDTGVEDDANPTVRGDEATEEKGALIELDQFASFDDYLAALVASKKGLTSNGHVDQSAQSYDSPNGYSSKTLNELKDLCRREGLLVSGTKAELIARLSAR